MYCIIITGMPCSGKSTIAKRYSEQYGLRYISSGDIAREMAQNDITIHRALEKGLFAPEEMMRNIISNKINNCSIHDTPFIIDGFPRFADQDKFLIEQLCKLNIVPIYVLINIEIDICLSRAKRRQRNDDVVIEDRIDYFIHETLPPIMEHSPIIMSDMISMTNDDIVSLLNNYITQARKEV